MDTRRKEIAVPVSLVVSIAVVAVVLIGFTLIRRPRQKRRQVETARRIFEGEANEPWPSTPIDDWSADTRDAAIRFYNSAGRQVRIGAIRLGGVPTADQTLAESIATDLSSEEAERWTDLTWLGHKLRRETRSATSRRRSSTQPAETEKLTKPGAAGHAEGSGLASALDLTADAGDAAVAADTDADARFERIVSGDTMLTEVVAASVATGDSDDDPTLDAEAEADTADDTTSPDDGERAHDDNATQRGLLLAESMDDGEPLPSIPAWILEARAALDNDYSVVPSDDELDSTGTDTTTVEQTSDSDTPDGAAADGTDADLTWPDPLEVAIAEAAVADADSEPEIDLTKLEPASTSTAQSETHPEPELGTAEGSTVGRAMASVTASEGASDETTAVEGRDAGPPRRSSSFSPAMPAETVAASSTAKTEHSDDDATVDDEAAKQCTADAVLLAEIKRFERKAKKARRKAKEARDVAMKRARQNRSKAARAAALLNKEQRQRARKFSKRAEKLRRSLSD